MHAISNLLLAALAIGAPLCQALPAEPSDINFQALKTVVNSRLHRREFQEPFEGLPGCDTEETDPTWAKGQSQWKDGEGTLIGSDCDNGDDDEDHCVTDYFIVGVTSSFQKWRPVLGGIYCPDSGTCSQTLGKESQTCKTFEVSVTETISLEASAVFATIGGSLASTQGFSYQWCNGESTTNECTWNSDSTVLNNGDNGANGDYSAQGDYGKDSGDSAAQGTCHTVWASDLTNTVHGYTRRSCGSPTSEDGVNMPDSPQRNDTLYTRGMQDFAVPLPGISAINCNGECNPEYAGPGPLPYSPNGGKLLAYTG